jgi:hypothetical protein
MEVVVFENNTVYDNEKVHDDAIELFTSMCKRYVSPEYLSKESTCLHNGGTFVTYADISGGDKPCMVMIFGTSPDMYEKIKQALEEMYEEYNNR